MFVRPNIKRSRRNFIYQGNGKSQSREVYTFNVAFAGLTSFDSDVVVVRGVKIAKFRWTLFATISAGHSSK
jgi:hypothetical protein